MSSECIFLDIPPPRDILVEVTNRCNHKCIFCAHHKMEHRQGEIEVSLLKRILQEAYEMGLRRVGLYTTGEMFMCKNMASHISNAKDIGYEYVYTDTNGALANKENLSQIISAGVDSIKFSINAGTRETYAFIHGYDEFDKVIENLKACHELKIKANRNLKIMVSFVITKQTETEVELLQDIVSPYVDKFIPIPVLPFFAQYDDDLSFLKTKSHAYEPPDSCLMVTNRIHVTFDGFLSACCVDFNHDLLLADLKKTSLKEAWICKNARKFREAHKNNQLEGTMCYGCLKMKHIPYTPLKVE